MNILVCSAGRRVKLVSYFKKELEKIGGKLVAVDCDPSAPALHFADKTEIVPPITHPEYIEHIKQLCKLHSIDAVISLIDPELTLLANYKEEFESQNVKIIVSNQEVVNVCFDKYLTYKFLQENNLPSIPTYLQIDEIIVDYRNNQLNFPLVIKPRRGSASLGISIVHSIEELYTLWKENEDLIAQPLINGNEYGIDCFVDLLSYRATNIFCKRKIKMRAGETDKSMAVNDPSLFLLIEELIQKLKPWGPIDIDCFKTHQGYVISEINPRFGGGYPHAHEEGQNFIRNLINNLKGIPNKVEIGNYPEGSVMIKYDDVLILKSSKIELNQVNVKESV